MNNEFYELLKELCSIPGPTGDESRVREFIRAKAEPFADKIRVTPLGGLLIFKKGKSRGKTLMYDAHMDEVGFIITGVRADGTLRFDQLGGINTHIAVSRRVKVNGHPGVVGTKPLNALRDNDRNDPGGYDNLYIDLGVDSREEALKLAAPGDTAVFDSPFVRFGTDSVKANAIDDRGGCALLLTLLMKEELPYDTWFSFSTMEEHGGASRTSAFAVRPDFAVVVESTTAGDMGGVPGDKQVCRQGGGAVVSYMDGATIYPPELYRAATALAREKGIPVQTKEAIAGGNNAGNIHTTAEGVRCVAVSLPCRYIHSPSCVVRGADIQASYDLLRELNSMLGGWKD